MIDPRETIRAVAADVAAGVPVAMIGRGSTARSPAPPWKRCITLAASHGTDVVVLSGGVFQNRRLLESVSDALAGAGLRVLAPERLPPNDGGISYGQAAVAAALLA